MMDDYALVWWDQAGNSQGSSKFGLCYINKGQRWSLGSWPRGEQPFFDRTLPCR